MSEFVAKAPYEVAHPSALAIYCSDGRFTTAVEERMMDSPEQIRARQIDDLRIGARALRRVKSDLDVRLYFAQPTAKRVAFEPIELG